MADFVSCGIDMDIMDEDGRRQESRDELGYKRIAVRQMGGERDKEERPKNPDQRSFEIENHLAETGDENLPHENQTAE